MDEGDDLADIVKHTIANCQIDTGDKILSFVGVAPMARHIFESGTTAWWRSTTGLSLWWSL